MKRCSESPELDELSTQIGGRRPDQVTHRRYAISEFGDWRREHRGERGERHEHVNTGLCATIPRDGGAVGNSAGKTLALLEQDRAAVRADDLERFAQRINEDAAGRGQFLPGAEGDGSLRIVGITRDQRAKAGRRPRVVDIPAVDPVVEGAASDPFARGHGRLLPSASDERHSALPFGHLPPIGARFPDPWKTNGPASVGCRGGSKTSRPQADATRRRKCPSSRPRAA